MGGDGGERRDERVARQQSRAFRIAAELSGRNDPPYQLVRAMLSLVEADEREDGALNGELPARVAARRIMGRRTPSSKH